MGLDRGDLEKIQADMTVAKCYKRICSWHQKHGKTLFRERPVAEQICNGRYLLLLWSLPAPEKANQADMDFVFGEVLSGLLEWSYHQQDKFGIKMAAYAQFAINKQYPSASNYPDYIFSGHTSELFQVFGKEGSKSRNC